MRPAHSVDLTNEELLPRDSVAFEKLAAKLQLPANSNESTERLEHGA